MIDIKLGQLYSFHMDPKDPIISYVGKPNRDELIYQSTIVMEVIRIDGAIFISPIKDSTGWFTVGTEYISKQSDIIHSGNYRLIWDPVMISAVEYGIDCTKCKRNYPDAERVINFECWSCRNGF